VKAVIVKLKWRLVRVVVAGVAVIFTAVNYGDNTCTHTSARFTNSLTLSFSHSLFHSLSPSACMSIALCVCVRILFLYVFTAYVATPAYWGLLAFCFLWSLCLSCICVVVLLLFAFVCLYICAVLFAVASQQTINQSAVLTSNCWPQTILPRYVREYVRN